MGYYSAIKSVVGGLGSLVIAVFAAWLGTGWYPPTLFGILGAALLVAGVRALRADGPQDHYETLPPEEREGGDLAGVPQVYAHRRCGKATRMPEEIVRSYLQNPYFYTADETYCTGCRTHVPLGECVWTETGEDLQTYMDRLRAEKPELRPGPLKRALIGLGKRL
jgi:hypothetical protein